MRVQIAPRAPKHTSFVQWQDAELQIRLRRFDSGRMCHFKPDSHNGNARGRLPRNGGSTPSSGTNSRRGCRLATALLLQRRSVEFDPPPRHHRFERSTAQGAAGTYRPWKPPDWRRRRGSIPRWTTKFARLGELAYPPGLGPGISGFESPVAHQMWPWCK